MANMKAIETLYNGYKFRSRLEARWAVFFDSCGIRYEYEPEGFELSNGECYLPDFYLPDLEAYIEVKRDADDGRQEVKTKCLNAVTWGGEIQTLVILSSIPDGSSPDGGLWHFPAIYWRWNEPYCGWWFFFDCADGVSGKVSSANYVSSSLFMFKGFFRRCYGDTNANPCGSLLAVSDTVLQRICGYCSLETLSERILDQERCNTVTFGAYRYARQARFEHGEKPGVNNG